MKDFTQHREAFLSLDIPYELVNKHISNHLELKYMFMTRDAELWDTGQIQ